MSLYINTQKSIKFGEESFTPSVNAEQALRLQNAKLMNAEEIEAAKKLIAECFGENKIKVAQYLEQADFYQLALIQAYLVGGDEMVTAIKNKMGGV